MYLKYQEHKLPAAGLVPVSINTQLSLGTLLLPTLTSPGGTQLVSNNIWSRLAKTLPNRSPKTLQRQAQKAALHNPNDLGFCGCQMVPFRVFFLVRETLLNGKSVDFRKQYCASLSTKHTRVFVVHFSAVCCTS